ncbi:MAG: transposase [Opitutales bacterium]
MGRNEIVALVGLAPHPKDSGKKKGKRRIEAGRAKVRRCLYMAAQTAAVHNPHIKAYVNHLREREKAYKQAITAAMRKLLLHLRTLLKKQILALA